MKKLVTLILILFILGCCDEKLIHRKELSRGIFDRVEFHQAKVGATALTIIHWDNGSAYTFGKIIQNIDMEKGKRYKIVKARNDCNMSGKIEFIEIDVNFNF